MDLPDQLCRAGDDRSIAIMMTRVHSEDGSKTSSGVPVFRSPFAELLVSGVSNR